MHFPACTLAALVLLLPASGQVRFQSSLPRASQTNPLINTYTDVTLMADLDGDGDQDALFDQQIAWNQGNGFMEISNLTNQSGYVRHAAAGDLDGDGDADLVVISDRVRILRHDGNQLFTYMINGFPWTYYKPRTCCLGDVDRDGDLDLLVGHESKQQNRMYLNDGKGNFTESTYGLPTSPDDTVCLLLIDVDGDKDLDLVTGNHKQPALLSLNDGKGHFKAAPNNLPLTYPQLFCMTAGDLDGDGDPDLVIGVEWDKPNEIWFNTGKGVFATAPSGLLPGPNWGTRSIQAADFDRDGDLDLALGAHSRRNQLFLNNGKGRFTDATATWMPPIEDWTLDLAVGDWNGDGRPDLVVANIPELHTRPHNGRDMLLLNQGASFRDLPPLGKWDGFFPPIKDSTAALLLVDVDGDGDKDLLVGNDWRQENRCYRNNGRGRFTDATAGVLPPHKANTLDLGWGDLDGDGLKDLVLATWGQNQVYRQHPPGTFKDMTAGTLPTASDNTVSVAVGDIDGDGDLDLVFGNHGQDQVLLNDGKGLFTDNTGKALPPDTRKTESVELADLDGDGDLDLVTAGPGRHLLLNDGKGAFQDVTLKNFGPGNPNYLCDVLTADLDGDGHLDLVFSRNDYHAAGMVYFNNGKATFTLRPYTLPNPMGIPKTHAVADLDGDGDLDVIAGCWPSYPGGNNTLYFNDGKANFTAGVAVGDRDATRAIAVGDLDGDGDPDLVFGNRTDTAEGAQNKIHFNLSRQVMVSSFPRVGRYLNITFYAQSPLATGNLTVLPLLGSRLNPLAIQPYGTLWLDTKMLISLPPVQVAQTQGYGSLSIPIPPTPALGGLLFHLQALIEGRNTSGRIWRFSNTTDEAMFR